MRDLELLYLDRITRAAESTATSARHIRKEVKTLVTWVQRLALIAALWGSGLGLHLSTDQVAEIITAVLRSWAKL